MKPYGNKRTENAVCEFGCCHRCTVHRGTNGYQVHASVKRRARKHARQDAKREIEAEVSE